MSRHGDTHTRINYLEIGRVYFRHAVTTTCMVARVQDHESRREVTWLRLDGQEAGSFQTLSYPLEGIYKIELVA